MYTGDGYILYIINLFLRLIQNIGREYFKADFTRYTYLHTYLHNIILRPFLLIINQPYFNPIRNPSLGRRTSAVDDDDDDDVLARLSTRRINMSIGFISRRSVRVYLYGLCETVYTWLYKFRRLPKWTHNS